MFKYSDNSITINDMSLDDYLTESNEIILVHKMVEVHKEKYNINQEIQSNESKISTLNSKIKNYTYSGMLSVERSNRVDKFDSSNAGAACTFFLYLPTILLLLYLEWTIEKPNVPFWTYFADTFTKYDTLTNILHIIIGIALLYGLGYVFYFLSKFLSILVHRIYLKISPRLKAKVRKEIEQTLKNNQEYKNSINELNQSNSILKRKSDLLDIYIKKYSILRERFNTYNAYYTISEYFLDGRADTIKEALNLYVQSTEMQQYQNKMLSIEQQKANAVIREQQRQREILENIKREEVTRNEEIKRHNEEIEKKMEEQNDIIHRDLRDLKDY